MKKFVISAIACLFVASFVSCEKNEKAGGEQNATATKDSTKQAPNTPPAANDEFIKKAESLPRTTAKFDNETFDFKTIKEGDQVTHRFNFDNTGQNDLVITNVKPSCGCTTPSWSKDPVKPGGKGYIDVTFNSTGKEGQQTKSITVTGNFEGEINKTLKLVGEIKASKAKPEAGKDGAKPVEPTKESH